MNQGDPRRPAAGPAAGRRHAGAGVDALEIDVALVPDQARRWPPTVCIVVDQLRASSTLTTLLDLGCAELFLTRGLAEARRLRDGRDALLAGERRGLTPRGFDSNNSPTELAGHRVRGRPVILSTANGTAVLSRLVAMPAVLVGCARNASAVARAAVELAAAGGPRRIGVVCAGVLGRFALDDAVVAGLIVGRLTEALERRTVDGPVHLSDGAIAAVRIAATFPDVEAALRASETGRVVIGIGAEPDIPFCAAVDASHSVGILRPGSPSRIERLD